MNRLLLMALWFSSAVLAQPLQFHEMNATAYVVSLENNHGDEPVGALGINAATVRTWDTRGELWASPDPVPLLGPVAFALEGYDVTAMSFGHDVPEVRPGVQGNVLYELGIHTSAVDFEERSVHRIVQPQSGPPFYAGAVEIGVSFDNRIDAIPGTGPPRDVFFTLDLYGAAAFNGWALNNPTLVSPPGVSAHKGDIIVYDSVMTRYGVFPKEIAISGGGTSIPMHQSAWTIDALSVAADGTVCFSLGEDVSGLLIDGQPATTTAIYIGRPVNTTAWPPVFSVELLLEPANVEGLPPGYDDTRAIRIVDPLNEASGIEAFATVYPSFSSQGLITNPSSPPSEFFEDYDIFQVNGSSGDVAGRVWAPRSTLTINVPTLPGRMEWILIGSLLPRGPSVFTQHPYLFEDPLGLAFPTGSNGAYYAAGTWSALNYTFPHDGNLVSIPYVPAMDVLTEVQFWYLPLIDAGLGLGMQWGASRVLSVGFMDRNPLVPTPTP